MSPAAIVRREARRIAARIVLRKAAGRWGFMTEEEVAKLLIKIAREIEGTPND